MIQATENRQNGKNNMREAEQDQSQQAQANRSPVHHPVTKPNHDRKIAKCVEQNQIVDVDTAHLDA